MGGSMSCCGGSERVKDEEMEKREQRIRRRPRSDEDGDPNVDIKADDYIAKKRGEWNNDTT